MERIIWLLVFINMYLSVPFTDAARILLIPTAHYSYVNFFAVAAKALQDDGHDVTVIVAKQYEGRITSVGVPSLAYSLSEGADVHKAAASNADELFTGKATMFDSMADIKSAVNELCKEFLGNEEINKFVKNGNFDLSINDANPATVCMYALNYKYDVPYITIGPYGYPWMLGVSVSPAHEPTIVMAAHGRLTFIGRLLSLAGHILTNSPHIFNMLSNPDLIHEYIPNKPYTTYSDLIKKSEMMLITSEINCFDFPKVSAPHFRYIGSLSGSVKSKPLPTDLNEFVKNAEHGIIVVSFGSIQTLRRALLPVIQKLLDALGKLPQKAILQFTADMLKNHRIPDNVMISSWLPQSDLLGHPKTKLFVSHGGINSHLESIYCGVPILTLPFHYEQYGNGKRLEAKGYGRLLEWMKTTSDEIYETMKDLIENTEYENRVKKCAAILSDLPDAKDLLVFWTNHILKFGGSHLRPVSADMSTIEFFMIDVILFLTSICFMLLLGYICCIHFIRKRCCGHKKVKPKKHMCIGNRTTFR